MPTTHVAVRLSSVRGRRALVAEREGEDAPIAALGLSTGAVLVGRRPQADAAVRALRRVRYRVLRQGGEVVRLTSLRTAPAAA
jgi:hypothetical protein